MALNIKNAETEQLARELADATGESLTEAVTLALKERLAAMRRRARSSRLRADVAQIQKMVATLPIRDPRSAEEILGYDRFGLPS